MSNARKLADNLPTEGHFGNRNLIINGSQNVNQRGNRTGLTGITHGTDRFEIAVSGRDELVYSIAQDSDVPSGYGFANSLKFTTTTAESAIASDEYFDIWQQIEAQNLQHLAYGTSSAKKVTLSFWVKSSVTGTFCVGLYKDDAAGSLTNQIHNKTYTISSASTWEHKTITFEANTLTGGGMVDDSGVGLYVTWHLAVGSNFDSGSSTSSGWANYTTTNWCEPNTTDAVITTTNATFQLTGVQLEVGSQASPFEHEPYETTLRKCQRYFYKVTGLPNGKHIGSVVMRDNQYFYGYPRSFPTPMRSPPTLTYSGVRLYVGDHTNGFTTMTLAAAETDAFSFNGSAAGAVTAAETGHTGLLYMDTTSSNHVTFNAEL